MQQAPPTSPFVPMLHMTAQNMKALIRIHEKQEEEIESDSHSISLKLICELGFRVRKINIPAQLLLTPH
jgi:hypothetical protein